MRIHPSAVVDAGAELGKDVQVGPYAVIESDTTIGDGCIIDAHAVVRRYVSLGKACEVGPHVVLGGLPQDLTFDRQAATFVEIGSRTVFREGVTVNRGTLARQRTVIGSDCYFMNNAHVAHDCRVGDRCIFATSATLGGHVQVGDRVFMGGGAMVHQFCRVGTLAIVAGVIGVRKDVLPYAMVGGQPVRHYRVNTIGLRRASLDAARIKAVSLAFRAMKQNPSAMLDTLRHAGIDQTDEIRELLEWLSAPSKRGIYRFASKEGSEE